MLTYSEYIHKAQNKLLAHTYRAHNSDPIRQCTLQPSSHVPVELTQKRVGRPRKNWTHATYERLTIKNTGTFKAIFKEHADHYIKVVLPKITDRSIRT